MVADVFAGAAVGEEQLRMAKSAHADNAKMRRGDAYFFESEARGQGQVEVPSLTVEKIKSSHFRRLHVWNRFVALHFPPA